MEFENLVKLIQAVSDSELTQFSYEEKGVSLSMKKEKKEKIIAVEHASMPQVATAEVNGATMELGEAKKEASFDGNGEVSAGWNFLHCSVPGRRSFCQGGRHCQQRAGAWNCGSHEANERN